MLGELARMRGCAALRQVARAREEPVLHRRAHLARDERRARGRIELERHVEAVAQRIDASAGQLDGDGNELLQFIATELHKGFAPFTVVPSVGEDSKRWATNRLTSRVAFLQAPLGSNRYLNGDAFAIADAYFALRIFGKVVKSELEAPLRDDMGRLTERPSVRSALEAEGVTA
ncbi:Glutathione S-transferase [Minicystis rosea]|nr:Glutathione S-transferase [Minicystis rosea]